MRRFVLPELEQVDGGGADGEEGDVHVGSHLQAEHLGLRVPVHLHSTAGLQFRFWCRFLQ